MVFESFSLWFLRKIIVVGVLSGIFLELSLIVSSPVSVGNPRRTIPSLKHSDVVFMYQAKPEIYKIYGGTFLAWGGHPRSIADIDSFKERVEKTQSIGVRYAVGIGWLTEVAGLIDFAPDFLDAVCVNLKGERLTVPWLWDHKHKGHPFYLFLDIHPIFKAFIERNTRWSMKAKPDAFHIDDLLGSSAIGASGSGGGCFNEPYIAGFRKYIQEKVPGDSLRFYGITDVDTFDYAQFLRNRSDRPLWDYYCLYTLKSSMAGVQWLQEIIREELGRDIPMSGNAAYSSWRHLPFATILDYLSCEVREDAEHGLTGAPLLDYKIAEALHKPIAATGFGGEWAYVKAHDVPGLVRGWIAQGYAFGQNYMAPNKQWCYTKELGTHWYDGRVEDYAPVFQFIRRNANLFDDYEPVQEVGFLLSFTNYRRNQRVFSTILPSLASQSVPFGVAIAGDEWLDIELTPEVLNQFKTLIIPEPPILNVQQKAVLDNWATRNTLVTWKGMEDFFNNYKSPITVEGAKNIWVVPRAIPKNTSAPIVLHLLNRKYLKTIDKYSHCKDFTITINNSLFADRTFSKAELYAYNRQTVPLKIQVTDKSTSVHVPELDVWGMVTLE